MPSQLTRIIGGAGMSWLSAVGTLGLATLFALAPPSIHAVDGLSGPAPQEVVVDTVAGRPVVTTEFPRRGGDAGAWRLVEELGLGNVMGDGPEGFGDIQDIAVDPGGSIYVLDVGSEEVRAFGRDGAYLRTMAREGEGPGEFRYGSTNRITWRAPGQLWIGNGYQLMVVDTLGSELSRHVWKRPGRGWMPGEVPITRRVIAAGTDGSVFSVVNVTVRLLGDPDEGEAMDVHVVRSPVSEDHDMLPGDTLVIESRKMVETAPPETVANREGSTISLRWVRPEDPRFVWTVESGGTLWLAHRSRYRFHRLTFTGDTVRTVQVGDVPPPPAAEDEFVPILTALASSPEGWLWVQREEPETEGGSTWDVLDNCGRYRATVSAPVGLRRVEVGPGGELSGISSNELDLDFVHRFRLRSEVGTVVTAEECPF
ncbi:MAG: hypothetical protein OXI71_11870 [Gemmatimonadota bacterium]|nr:hypothetical protein [Gemmatimonadota bacterium]